MTLIDDWQVYVSFRHAQGIAKGKHTRLPKSWDDFKCNKMSPTNLAYLNKTVDMFNTVYHNVDLNLYMATGFDIYKGFSYHQFLDPKIIELYKRKVKQKQRKQLIDKATVKDSFIHIKRFMTGKDVINGYNRIQTYCKMKDGHQSVVVRDYHTGAIDRNVLTYFLYKKYLTLNDDERSVLGVFVQNYREYVNEMLDVKTFIEKCEVLV